MHAVRGVGALAVAVGFGSFSPGLGASLLQMPLGLIQLHNAPRVTACTWSSKGHLAMAISVGLVLAVVDLSING